MEYTKEEFLESQNMGGIPGYVIIPQEWIGNKKIFLLNVSKCRHFRKEGIRDGSCIGIDYSAPFTEGKASAFGRIIKGKHEFKMSRTVMDGYIYLGQLAFVFTPVA